MEVGGSPVPTLVLICFAAMILWGRFGTLKTWLGERATPAVPAAISESDVTSPSHAQ